MIETIIFYCFAVLMLLSALAVITVRNPVQGALFLVLAFVCAAGLWMLLEAEFLSLILVVVYVGAVMTLFLFVVMMMNLDHLPSREIFKRYLPYGLVILIVLLIVTLLAIQPQHFGLASQTLMVVPASTNNVLSIGSVLYTNYLYAFELAAVILLVSIVAAIVLAFYAPARHIKHQQPAEQIKRRREEVIELRSLATENKKP